VSAGGKVEVDRGGPDLILRLVMAIGAIVVGLTFLFGFGNAWILGLKLGVPAYVAPLVAPAVDLSVVALLLALRRLASAGGTDRAVRSARALLMFASGVTLALNVAAPVLAGLWGRAAFDAVGPLLLIGWSHVGPELLSALAGDVEREPAGVVRGNRLREPGQLPGARRGGSRDAGDGVARWAALRARAVEVDRAHWRDRGRPVSAERLRGELGVASGTARALVRELRAGAVPRGASHGPSLPVMAPAVVDDAGSDRLAVGDPPPAPV